MAGNITKNVHSAWDYPTYVNSTGTAKTGQEKLAAGFQGTSSALSDVTEGRPFLERDGGLPTAVEVGTSGYLFLKNHEGTARTVFAVAGAQKAIQGMTDIDGLATNTTANDITFLYNHSK